MSDGSTPRQEAPPDEVLVDRFKSGTDPEGAFKQLFDRYATSTYAFFRRRIGQAEIAAEQNQDLYISVLEHLAGFRGECTFRTWLFRMARNRLGHLRRRWRVHLDEQPAEVPDELWDRLSATSERPDESALRSRVAAALRRCIARLSEIERAVVLGQYYHGVSLQELTDKLELTNKSGARASLIAAQRRLKRCLEAAGFDSLGARGMA
jgi:RNA polymerase sigma-70 factor (ECF subfamily)